MMLSRMAEALYWMARYLERADNTARILEINLLYLIGGEQEGLGAEQWEPLLTITGSTPAFFSMPENETIEKAAVVSFLTRERLNPNSIFNCIRLARENARAVRDLISKEMWESLNQTWLSVENSLREPLALERAPAFFSAIRSMVARFYGVSDGTMMAGESYGFYRLGIFMERADMSTRILDVKYHILLPSVEKVGTPLDFYQWGALLKSLSGFEAYRRLHHTGLQPIDVTEFVIFNPNFPRSLVFCVERMSTALGCVGVERNQNNTDRALDATRSFLKNNTSLSAFQVGLHEFLQDFLRHVAAVNAAAQADFFEPNLGGRHAVLDPAQNQS